MTGFARRAFYSGLVLSVAHAGATTALFCYLIEHSPPTMIPELMPSVERAFWILHPFAFARHNRAVSPDVLVTFGVVYGESVFWGFVAGGLVAAMGCCVAPRPERDRGNPRRAG